MNYSILLYIARNHIFTRAKQSAIAGLGVTFGIATFIILISFMTGLNGLLDGLILDRTPHIHLFNEIVPSERQPIDLSTDDNNWNIIRSVKPKLKQSRIHNALPILKILEEDETVLGATAQVATQAFYTAGSINLNGMISGVNILEESRLFNIDNYIIEGNIYDLHNNDNAIIVGAGVSKKMSLELGDKIQLVSPKGNRVILKIVGIYQSGLAEIDNIQSYVNLKTAQRIMGEGNNYITDINLKLHDINNAFARSKDLERIYNVTAIDIGTANAQFDTGTTIRNIITYAVSITLLIVAGFGIYNILNMFIYEKMNDIAILKATGFSGNDVMFIFVSQALIIGLIGGALGLLVGYVLSVLIDNVPFVTDSLPTITTYPVNFNPNYYIVGIVFAMVSTFLAGYLPAKKAKNIDPVEILRGQ
ncbi:MAG: lipoprotein-releasing system permease protein [Saprospiraceae bacterium]|mgnify:CR=1 FL=1|jgi:lipoprotein-releasing system permease protein